MVFPPPLFFGYQKLGTAFSRKHPDNGRMETNCPIVQWSKQVLLKYEALIAYVIEGKKTP